MASYDSDSDGVQSLRDASIHPMSQTGSGNILFDLALLKILCPFAADLTVAR